MTLTAAVIKRHLLSQEIALLAARIEALQKAYAVKPATDSVRQA